jgi:hypothetical protein
MTLVRFFEDAWALCGLADFFAAELLLDSATVCAAGVTASCFTAGSCFGISILGAGSISETVVSAAWAIDEAHSTMKTGYTAFRTNLSMGALPSLIY